MNDGARGQKTLMTAQNIRNMIRTWKAKQDFVSKPFTSAELEDLEKRCNDVIKDNEVIFSVYWHPLTIAERESIIKKSGTEDNNDYALQMMIEKALDKDGKRLFQDGDKASLRREIEASILEEIQLAMVNSGADKEVKEAKADLKS